MTKQSEEMMHKTDMESKCAYCPECAVLFDKNGYHGCVPDSHSETCKKCIEEKQ